MTTGKKIRARRKQLGMSVDDLAAKLGKNRATIYRYENDMIEMPASLLKPLAEILDTTPGELMDWGDIMVSEIEHQEKMCELLPQIRDGLSIEGERQKYLLFKVSEKKAFRWDRTNDEWVPFYQITYQYDDRSGEIKTNYGMWDKKKKNFSLNVQNMIIPSTNYEEIFS